MPSYRVDATERFLVRTSYYVEADSPKEAERLCKAGEVAYDDKEVLEGGEEWIKTEDIEELPA